MLQALGFDRQLVCDPSDTRRGPGHCNMVSDGVRTLPMTAPIAWSRWSPRPVTPAMPMARMATASSPPTDPAVIRHRLGDGMEIDEAGVLTKIPNADIRKAGSTTCLVHRDHLSTSSWRRTLPAAPGRVSASPHGERTPMSASTCGAESRGVIGEGHDGTPRPRPLRQPRRPAHMAQMATAWLRFAGMYSRSALQNSGVERNSP